MSPICILLFVFTGPPHNGEGYIFERERYALCRFAMIDNRDHEHPVVEPHVSHFKQVPLRTSVKLAHSGQLSPT